MKDTTVNEPVDMKRVEEILNNNQLNYIVSIDGLINPEDGMIWVKALGFYDPDIPDEFADRIGEDLRDRAAEVLEEWVEAVQNKIRNQG